MRKKVNLLILLFVAVAILSIVLVACSSKDVSGAPDEVGTKDPEESIVDRTSNTDENLMLRFVFRKYMSSVFTAIPIEEFTSEDFVLGDYINYQVIYSATGLPFEDKLYPLTTDMIDADCIGYLSQPGRHTIKVSLPRKEGKDAIKGSFTLNLSEPASNLEFVTLTFALNGGEAYFGTTNRTENTVSVEVQKGTQCDWDAFEREFLVKRKGYVLDGLTPDKFGPRYEDDSEQLETIVFDEDKTYSLMWIENMIQVTFNLNKPSDAILDTDKGVTQKQINDAIITQSVEMYRDTVARPDSNIVNSYLGYSFSGWYYRDPDEGNKEKLWLFTQTVGRKNIALYGKWTPRYYTFQIFTMGGKLKADLHDTVTEEQIAEQNLVYATCDIKFDLSSEDGRDINDITFGELTYHKRHYDYVVKVQVSRDSEETVTIKLNEILTLLEKGGDIFKTNGIYRNAMHTADSRFMPDGSTKVEKDEICYLEWIMQDAVKADPSKFSDYYINYAFKGDDGIVLKADGTLRINRLYDASMNELIVPATLRWPENNAQGYTERPITEIGDRALSNAKSLIKVDMSGASNLTTISTRAFCYCQNLTEVAFPTENNITYVGEDAFSRTAWQNNLFGEGEYGLIVIGTSIYKLAGDGIDELDTVDLVGDALLNDYLEDDVIYNIAPGCFAETTALERVILPDNVNYIHNLAFNGLANLGAVITGPDSKLYYIGETAFSGCTKFMAGEDPQNISDGAIVIGNVLYRLLDKDATSYNVKSNVKNIAPSAFISCTKLVNITFEDASKIETIGKDAFIDTPWAQTKSDGYTIVNGILANVHSQDFKNRNVSLPSTVTSISEYAFGSYARYIETVEFRASVKRIDGYAFAGASSMKSFIFTDAAYDNVANAIINIPTIDGDSFANAKGVLLSGVKLYFSQAVYDFFATERCKETNPDWYEFFRLYPSAFAVEQIQGVWVNPAVVPSAFINNGVDVPFADSYENGLVIMSSSGVTKYDTLDKNENAVSFATGEGEHILRFTYKGEDKYCHNEDKDAHVFKYNIRNAIAGSPAIGSTLDASGKTDADFFWIETYQGKSDTGKEIWARAFLGDVEGAAVPTFYTSHSTLDLANYRFAYKDAFYEENETENHVKYIEFSQAIGYAPTVNKNSHITFTIDFWGIGLYSVTASYSGAKSKYVEIIQKEAISIPLNGSESVYMRNSYVYLKGQDGREQKILFTLNTFKLVSVDGIATDTLPTDKLGMHKMRVSYTSDDALNTETTPATSTIFADIMYSVVLEADNSVFKFERLNERDKTIKIVACTNNTADTLVLPDKHVEGGVTYTVTEIGEGVFKDFTALRTVYLPATLKKIGKNAFAGCTLLEEIFTSTQTPYEYSHIPDANFEDARVEIAETGTIEVTSLLFTIIPNTLTVPEKFTWSLTDGIYEYSYTATPVFSADVFAKCKGTIWLFDSEYNRAYATEHLGDKHVEFYTAEDNRVPAAQSRFQLDKTKFVVEEIRIVKNSKLNSLANIDGYAGGDIVVTPYFDIPVVYNDVYQIINDETQEMREVRVPSGTEYTVPTGWTKASEAMRVATYEKDYISSTAATLQVPDGFDGFVYLPDFIYNEVKIVDQNGDEIADSLTIYKSGIETLVSTLEYVPDSLEYIGTTAFMGCINLRTIEFGENTNLSDICSMAFAGCSALETINYGKTAQDWSNIDLGPDWDKDTQVTVVCKA